MFAFPISHWGGSDSGNLPTHALDLERDSTQYLSMTDADFGAYDRAKWAISVWVKTESISTVREIFSHGGASANREFALFFTSANRLRLDTYIDSSGVNGTLETSATYTGTSAYMHILVHYDSANATAGDRMRMWVDGSEITSFNVDTNPTGSVFDSTSSAYVGTLNASGTVAFDGLIYQLGFFSGTLPAIADVYDSGNPKDISGLTGLYSYLDCAGNDPTSDGVLSTNWTNNNSVTTSTDIP